MLTDIEMEIRIYPRQPEKSYFEYNLDDLSIEDIEQSERILLDMLEQAATAKAKYHTDKLSILGQKKKIPYNS